MWPDGTLWTNSESGTDYYQNTAGWSRFYPFVYSIAGHRLIPGVRDVSTETLPPVPTGGTIVSYPNPFSNSTTLSLDIESAGEWSVVIVDILGRIVARVTEGLLASGEHYFTVDATGLPAGVYFAVATGPQGHISRPLTIVR